jgi:hypothetical protein
MNAQEVETQMKRIAAFNKLKERKQWIEILLNELARSDPKGPCGASPYTGNHRETRQVHKLHITFTPTRGGSPSVESRLDDLAIEANEFGDFLRGKMELQLKAIVAEMEAL